MKKIVFILLSLAFLVNVVHAQLINYPSITLSSSGTTAAGNFSEIWDLTVAPLTLTYTVDLNGMVDDFGGGAHAWSEFGIRTVGYGNFNPTWMTGGAGVWLATDYEWSANTFNPDPPGSPTLDIDDKLILQRGGGMDESYYDNPSSPPSPWDNYGLWFDRDGVDPWQALMWGAISGGTYNTGGIYNVVMSLNATSPTTGTAFMTINGVQQGFYVPNWHAGAPDIYPAGMNFTGDMRNMQIFYGLYGYGATHSVEFRNISASGYVIPEPSTIILLASGFLGLGVLGWLRRRKV